MNITKEPPGRFSTHKSQVAIAELLSLPEPGPLDQDWDLLVADPDRVTEFVALYENRGCLSDDEKFTLMEVILASYDDLLSMSDEAGELGRRIYKLLSAEFELHAYTIYYWCVWDQGTHPKENRTFRLTRDMRNIWINC